MTVKQLIDKLKKMPEDATVVVENDGMWVDGTYKVTSKEVDYFPEYDFVVIGTDYERKVKDE